MIGITGSSTETEIMNAARSLLETGVRRICISLKGSQQNPQREIAFKKIIDQQYPDHFLGSVPVLAGSDISQSPDDRTRTYCALINAYTHGALAATLFKAEDELRVASKYSGAFLVSHINGGVAGIAKTKAIDTIESGPILGILGSAHLAKSYGLNEVVAMDVGGTTAKISVLRNGEPIYRKPSDLFGNPIEVSLPFLRSIALGGGSVVKPQADSQPPSVQLGPESMGSFPGPASYGLGGDQATLTDAFVAAGIINPQYFLGGSKPIDLELARKTIESLVAQPLKLNLDEACKIIIDRAFAAVAKMIADAQKELCADLSAHALFAYGGNGGLFGAGVAANAGLKRVLVFSLGPVFSAFGSSVSDICHVYERPLSEAAITEAGLARIRRAFEEIKAECAKDLLGEGIRPEGLAYSLEFEIAGEKGSSPVAFTEDALASEAHLKSAIAKAIGDGQWIERQAGRPRAAASPREKTHVETAFRRARAEQFRSNPRPRGHQKNRLGQPHRRSANLSLGIAAAGKSHRRLRSNRRREHHVSRSRWLDTRSRRFRKRVASPVVVQIARAAQAESVERQNAKRTKSNSRHRISRRRHRPGKMALQPLQSRSRLRPRKL